eukprot:6174764-Pleurochrysis_carterae.AAC.4
MLPLLESVCFYPRAFCIWTPNARRARAAPTRSAADAARVHVARALAETRRSAKRQRGTHTHAQTQACAHARTNRRWRRRSYVDAVADAVARTHACACLLPHGRANASIRSLSMPCADCANCCGAHSIALSSLL